MAHRRAKGEGTVYYDDSVKAWVGQASAGVNPVTGKRRRVRVSASTKREAQARLRERILELERLAGTSAPGTVGDLLYLWMNREAPKTMSVRTQTMVRSMVENHVLPSLGQLKVGDLRVEHVEALLDAKAAEGLSRSSLIKLHSYLGQAFDAGARRRLVGWNPARIAVVPQARASREGRALTMSEARSLLNAAEADRLGAWVVVALLLGLRPGEVSALHWDAIDFGEARMVVYRSLSWTNGKPALKEPKTKKSRALRTPARAVEALRRHRKAQLEEQLLMGARWPDQWEGLVFRSVNGAPLDPSNVRRLVVRLAKEAGIEGHVRPYDLRHTATSLLSAGGTAPELLADLLGHVDTRMVFKHYRHPVTPTIEVAAVGFDDEAMEL